jgi:hypothetical protein
VDGINRFFSGLAGAMGGPKALDVARASVFGAQRENYNASARNYDASASKTYSEKAEIDGYNAASQEFDEVMRQAPELSRTPEGRAKISATLGRMRDGLRHGPKAAAGFTTFVDPNFVPRPDLSNIMVGAGVVDDFAKTPSGFDANQQRQRDQDAQDAQSRERVGLDANQKKLDADLYGADRKLDGTRYEADRAQGGKPGAPKPLSVQDVEGVAALIVDRLRQIGGDPNMSPPPDLIGPIMRDFATLYGQTGDVAGSIEGAISRHNPRATGGGWFSSPRVVGDNPTPLSETMTTPPAAAAPFAPPKWRVELPAEAAPDMPQTGFAPPAGQAPAPVRKRPVITSKSFVPPEGDLPRPDWQQPGNVVRHRQTGQLYMVWGDGSLEPADEARVFGSGR